MLRTVVLSHLLLVNTALAALAQTCIWKDGSVADNFLPCANSSASSGNCCLKGESCLESGLCYGSIGLVYRGACINEWGGDCLNYCDDISTVWANLYPCAFANTGSSDGPANWWCGPTDTSTCSTTNGTILKITPGIATKILSEVSSTSATASGAASSSSDPSAAASSNTAPANTDTICPPTKSNAPIIGLGAAIGIILLIALIGGIWGFRAYRKQQRILDQMYPTGGVPAQDNKGEAWQQVAPRVEMQGHVVGSEMGDYNSSRPAELGSGRPESEIGHVK